MRRFFAILIIIFFTASQVFGADAILDRAQDINVDTSQFDKNLSSSDDTVQKALDTLDDSSSIPINSTTATAGNILVADGTDFESVTLQGDCNINGAGFISCASFSGWSGSGNNIFLSDASKNVGIGVSDPSNKLEVDGRVKSETLETSDTAIVGSTSKSRITFTNKEYIDGYTDDLIKLVGNEGSNDTDLYINLDGSSPEIYSNADDTVTFGDDLQIGKNGRSGILKLYNELGTTDFITLIQNSPSQSGNMTWTLPPSCDDDQFLKGAANGDITCAPISGVTASSGDITAIGDATSGAAFADGGTGTTLKSTSGTFTLGGVGHTNNESISTDYESVADQISNSSTTGVTKIVNNMNNTVFSGNVGIGGTATPTTALKVTGSMEISGGFSQPHTGSVDMQFNPYLGHIAFGRNTSLAGFCVDVYRGTGQTGVQHALCGNNANTYFAALAGNVGIATTAPTAKLDVKGGGTTTGKTLQLRNSGSTVKTVFLDNGNVGLGTTAPTSLLELNNGSIEIDDTCIDQDSDRLYGDVNCNGVKDTGEEYFDQVGGGGGGGASQLSDLTDVGTTTATTGRLLVADGTLFNSVSMSGDGTINSAGVLTLSDNSLSLVELSDVNTSTATVGNILVADGTDWESKNLNALTENISTTGNLGINTTSPAADLDVNGSARVGNLDIIDEDYATLLLKSTDSGESIFHVSGVYNHDSIDNDYASFGFGTDPTLNNVLIFSSEGYLGVGTVPEYSLDVNGAIHGTSLAFGIGDLDDVNNTVTVTAGNILIADGTEFDSISLSGDVTVNSSGVTAITADSIALSDLSDVNTTTKTAGRILVADGTDFESMAMQGDATLNGAGFLNIANDTVGTAELTFINSSTATAGRILVADGTDFESMALQGDCTLNGAGFITCSGSGSTPKYHTILQPQQAKLPTSNQMAIDASNNRWRGLFDASTAESAQWEDMIYPYNGGALNGKVCYSMASATSGTVEFDVSIMCNSSGDSADIDTDSFGTTNVFTETVPGTAGYESCITLTSLNQDSCAQYDHAIIKVTRDATDGTNDTATGDAELRKVLIYE